MKFYRLEPLGMGTELMESLPSYLIRMANAHGRSVVQLLGRMIANQSELPALGNRVTQSESLVASGLAFTVRPTHQTSQLVSLIEQCCGVTGLRGSTFLSLERCSLRNSVVLYSQHLRWCPLCFLQDKSKRQSPYFRLLWSLQPITQCLEHRIPLESHCLHCQRPQSSGFRACRVDVCQYCGHSLGRAEHTAEGCSDDEVARHAVLAPLIQAISSCPELTYDAEATNNFVTWIADQPHCGRKRNELDERRQPLVPYRYVNTSRQVSLATCIRISARLRIGLDMYLGGNALVWNRAIFPEEPWNLPELPVGYVPGTSLTCSELTDQINNLREELDILESMPLSEFGDKLCIDVNDIVFFAPELAQEIQSDNAKFGIMQRHHNDTCAAVEHFTRLGREVSNNPRIRIAALLKRDFPELTSTTIDSVVEEAMASSWPLPMAVSSTTKGTELHESCARSSRSWNSARRQ